MRVRSKHWKGTPCGSKLIHFIWAYERKFGHAPTIERVAREAESVSLEDVMSDLRFAEECGWIKLHLEEEQDIELTALLSERAGLPEQYDSVTE